MKCWRLSGGVDLWLAMMLSGCLSAIAIQPGWAEVELGSREKAEPLLNSKIHQLSEIERPITSAQRRVQSPAPATAPITEMVQVTGVKANPTEKGVEVILQTTLGEQLQVVNRSADNSFIADIPNAQLRLPNGDTFVFRSQKPVAGITEITVTNFDANTIRVTVTGEAGVPKVELFDSSEEGLIFGVVSTADSTLPQQPETQPTLPRAEPGSETQPDEPSAEGEEEIEVVVTGEQETGYSVPNTSVGTRTDTPLRDIPQSIQIVPQEVLRDQNATNLNEALRNVPGVTSFVPLENAANAALTIRGFNTTGRSGSSFLRNGLREGGDSLTEINPGIERIEVLKGPASVLYGGANPGGTINLVSKQPLRDPFYAVDATIGNYDFYQGAIDLSGPLNDSKTVLYRLNAAYQDRGSFIDFLEREQFTIAPVVSFAIGERTRLIIEGEHTKRSTEFYEGLPAVGTILPNPNGRIPRDRFLGEPDRDFNISISKVEYRLEHQFSDNWSLNNAFRARTQSYSPENEPYAQATSLASDNRTLNRVNVDTTVDFNDYDLAANLVGKFSTGSIDHQLAVGVDLSRSSLKVERFTAPSPIDIFNPVYGQPVGPLVFTLGSDTTTDSLGIYVQNQVTLAENLKLLLGGRFDLFERTTQNLVTDIRTSQSGNAFSPRVGIVYQPIQPISLYASYSRSFNPVIGIASDGSEFQPERGTQYEIGVKADLNDRLSATLAFYDLTRSNVLTADTRPGVPSGFSIQTGEQRSRGVELSIAGEILPGWNIIAGYAYTDAQITQDNRLPVGNLLANSPENSFNLWTSYEIQRGSWKGFGVGAGLFFVGERQGDLDNSFQLPSYLRTDAAIFYKRDRFRVALNVRNLFNVDYFESATGRLNVYPGAPFTVQGTISCQF